MKGKKLKVLLDTSVESLFNDALRASWARGERVDRIILSERACEQFIGPRPAARKRELMVYQSDFGTPEVRIDRRYKGDRILFQEVSHAAR
jgi:hypothetical protein